MILVALKALLLLLLLLLLRVSYASLHDSIDTDTDTDVSSHSKAYDIYVRSLLLYNEGVSEFFSYVL